MPANDKETDWRNSIQALFWDEAIVPVEILSPTGRMTSQQIDPTATMVELDLLEGVRENTVVRTAAYKRKATEYFNRQVKPKFFQKRGLVRQNATATGHLPAKLGAN
ncbi:Uncharacterized protein Adt_35215 [Abeliophyllum distichum]|uniref:Uncharacterized protein n=1 Tax=Abeliophyllum distichum TaxID=126358 RepID=A0ABD1QF15_9LAMI